MYRIEGCGEYRCPLLGFTIPKQTPDFVTASKEGSDVGQIGTS
jgi:hypothetical protein